MRFRLGWLFLFVAASSIASLYLANYVFVKKTHHTAKSLLLAFVAAQSSGDEKEFLSLFYRPETMAYKEIIGVGIFPGLVVERSDYNVLPSNDTHRLVKLIGSDFARLSPTPTGQLHIWFEPKNKNGPQKSVTCYYGEIDGAFYICTYQTINSAE